jgi:hypothetical protein
MNLSCLEDVLSCLVAYLEICCVRGILITCRFLYVAAPWIHFMHVLGMEM